MQKAIQQEILKQAVDRRLPCAVARKIAEDLGVSYKEVGAAADAMDIKIKDCQLGCF